MSSFYAGRRTFGGFGKDISKTSLGVPAETFPGEKRVAISPEGVKRLAKDGFQIQVQKGAGLAAGFSDQAFVNEGATIVDNAFKSDIVLKVRPPSEAEISKLEKDSGLISFLYPRVSEKLIEGLKAKNITAFSMNEIPRLTRSQTYDALSSMANISGYKAVVEAANEFDRAFMGQITAAGRLPPAKVLVIGAGVAGLSSIVSAKNMGAVVKCFDTRPATKEQVESVGGQFLTVEMEEDGSGAGGYAKEMSPEFIKKEMELFAKQAAEVDVIITTALIPNKPAPKLILKEHVHLMKPGSIVIDLAAEAGGNCEYTIPGEINVVDGVKIVGFTDFPSRMASQASSLYANNLSKFIQQILCKEGKTTSNLEDEVARGAVITEKGELLWPNPNPPMLDAKPKKKEVEVVDAIKDLRPETMQTALALAGGLSSIVGLGILYGDHSAYHGMLTTFSLATVAGYQSVWGVKPALHTPLMSITNAISGVTAIGGLLLMGGGYMPHNTV